MMVSLDIILLITPLQSRVRQSSLMFELPTVFIHIYFSTDENLCTTTNERVGSVTIHSS